MKYYDIEENKFGYILSNENEKFVVYLSKIFGSKYQFYLKRVEPDTQFITGLFKKKNKYLGKTIDNKKVVVTLMNSKGIIQIG